jgi:hypothetical protein
VTHSPTWNRKTTKEDGVAAVRVHTWPNILITLIILAGVSSGASRFWNLVRFAAHQCIVLIGLVPVIAVRCLQARLDAWKPEEIKSQLSGLDRGTA